MQVCKQYSRVGCKRHPSPPLHPNRIQLISISSLNNWLRYCWSGKKQFYSWQTVIGRVEDYLPRRKVNSRGWEVGESDVNELLCMFWMCSIFRRGLTIIPIRRLYFPTWGSWGGRSKYNFFMDSQATERSAISRTIYKYMRLDVFDGYPPTPNLPFFLCVDCLNLNLSHPSTDID